MTELGAKVLEGWRVSETPGSLAYDPRAARTPVYRQANVGRLRLLLSARQWDPPRVTARWCVQPDDVVLNKLAPVRAAFVSAAARRHPVDGNSLIVRGLPRSAAAWLALCLNHPGYEQLLLIESGVLKRVGIGSLASLRIPQVPPEMAALSARLHDLLDELLLTGEVIHRARLEIDEVAGGAPSGGPDLRSGAFFDRETVSSESWLPSSAALRSEHATLAKDFGWVSLGNLASAGDRARLQHVPDGARALRLSDVAEDLFVASSDGTAAEADVIPSRTFAKQLIAGEVLVSTLGSSFRSAYVDDGVPPNTFPADGWVRLRFRETPAAWALLLAAEPVRSQAARLAVGSVQQFVPPEALLSLHIPTPTREVRDRWQRTVERHHAQRRGLDRQWTALATELAAVFDAVHRPFADTNTRRKEVLQ